MKFSMIIINLELGISNHVWRNEVDMWYYNIIIIIIMPQISTRLFNKSVNSLDNQCPTEM